LKKKYLIKKLSIKKFGAVVTILLLLLSASSIYAKTDSIDVNEVVSGSTSSDENSKVDKIITDYGGPVLDFGFIYKIVENLSYIVKDHPKGRAMGTSGEHCAWDMVVEWMQEAGLQNIQIDRISGEWTEEDSWQNLHNFLFDPDYNTDPWIGGLDLKRNFTEWSLEINIYDKNNNFVEKRSFSEGTCFPFLKEEIEDEPHKITVENIKVFDEFSLLNPDGIVLIEADWHDPYGWWMDNLTNLKRKNVKGFILMDCHDETFFMAPSGISSPTVERYAKPGFSINGSSGKWIKQYLNDPNYIVKADFISDWEWEQVDSYNVIGEIPGKSSKIAIINDFYDGWWNQATCDEAVGVGLILGIAKYLNDNCITPELTLKFICWGGHEWYFRGAKHYIKNNTIKQYDVKRSNTFSEDIKYVINPGNIGFDYTNDMSFNVGHSRDYSLMVFMQKIAEELKYTERTGIGIIGGYSVYGTEAWRFYHGHEYPERYCEYAVEFDRWPYPGYHRDARDHTLGDVFSEINDDLYRVDCEVIAEIILRLANDEYESSRSRTIDNSNFFGNWILTLLKDNSFLSNILKYLICMKS